MSNSFSALNEEEEEDVENVYDESANLIQNTKAGGSSSFTAAAVDKEDEEEEVQKIRPMRSDKTKKKATSSSIPSVSSTSGGDGPFMKMVNKFTGT
ncbi:hypothetical protein Tco_0865649 [Tanacetum coccineum]